MFSKEYIPLGTRFGPLQGEIYTKDNVPKQANRKYFWRVREYTLTWRIGLSVMGERLKYPLRKEKKISLSKFKATDSASSCLNPEKPIGFPDAEVSAQVQAVTSKASLLTDHCAAQEFWSKVLRKFFFQLVRKPVLSPDTKNVIYKIKITSIVVCIFVIHNSPMSFLSYCLVWLRLLGKF